MTSVQSKFTLLFVCYMLFNEDSLVLGQKPTIPNGKNNRQSNLKPIVCGSTRFGNSGKPESDSQLDDDGIRFPQQKNLTVQTRQKPSSYSELASPLIPPAGCINATFLTDVVQYPNNAINQLFKSKKLPTNFFFKDPEDDELMRFQEPRMPLCATKPQIMYPQAAKSKNDTWKYIIQGTDETLKQGIRVEICENEDKPCLFDSQNIPNGYTTYCVQKYIYRRLMALETTGEPGYDDFKIPSCCECMYSTSSVFNRGKSTK